MIKVREGDDWLIEYIYKKKLVRKDVKRQPPRTEFFRNYRATLNQTSRDIAPILIPSDQNLVVARPPADRIPLGNDPAPDHGWMGAFFDFEQNRNPDDDVEEWP
jgi:hypothetical protein